MSKQKDLNVYLEESEIKEPLNNSPLFAIIAASTIF